MGLAMNLFESMSIVRWALWDVRGTMACQHVDMSQSHVLHQNTVIRSQDIVQLEASKGAFAALRADSRVVTWGDARSGGDASSAPTSWCRQNGDWERLVDGGIYTGFSFTRKCFLGWRCCGCAKTPGRSIRTLILCSCGVGLPLQQCFLQGRIWDGRDEMGTSWNLQRSKEMT